jgi:hypothetical protein
MSESLTNLVAAVKTATDFQVNKKILKEKITTDLHLAYKNGLFKVDSNLISFLSNWDDKELILEDCYETPINVDRTELLDLAKQHYRKVMNFWQFEYDKLKQIRKI